MNTIRWFLLALCLVASPSFAGQDVFVSGNRTIVAADCGNTFYIDATSSLPQITFDYATNLTAAGTAQCQVTLKKLDLTSNQVTFSSLDGTVDGEYWDRRLIEPMDAVVIGAIMNSINGLGGIYVLARAHDHDEMRAMRTVTIQNYNVNPYDFEVEHRCNTASAGAAVSFYLPPLKQVIGTVPALGSAPNPNDPTQPAGYLTKTFHFTDTDSGGHGCYLVASSGETINGQPYISFSGRWKRIVAQAKGDGWTAQLLQAAP